MTTATATRDDQRSKVYRAEHALQFAYDHHAESAAIEVAGVALQLEPEARFGDLDGVQRYVDRVLAMPAVIARFGNCGPVTVRERKGARKAHYQDGEISLHTAGNNSERWSLRELVVNHELAHHFTPSCAHGAEFTAALTELIEIVMGPQAALALRLLYRQEGVR